MSGVSNQVRGPFNDGDHTNGFTLQSRGSTKKETAFDERVLFLKADKVRALRASTLIVSAFTHFSVLFQIEFVAFTYHDTPPAGVDCLSAIFKKLGVATGWFFSSKPPSFVLQVPYKIAISFADVTSPMVSTGFDQIAFLNTGKRIAEAIDLKKTAKDYVDLADEEDVLSFSSDSDGTLEPPVICAGRINFGGDSTPPSNSGV